jgi:hypothetical protein
MLIGDNLAYGEVMECLAEVEAEIGRDINPTIYTTEQFEKRVKEEHSFTTRVLEQPKLMIKGVINDARKLI